MQKTMNHGEYQRKLKNKTMPELRFILKDANEAISVNPNGCNSGYYADEIHYAAAELKRRKAA
jgi:hypothetical protein